MMLGFLIMGISTMALSFIGYQNITLWIIGLFLTRVGAAAAEIMIETYFFKTVPTKDSAVLGLFRLTRPSAYFFAPILTYFGLMITSDKYLFIIVGLICLIAIYPAYKIRDTI
jgi:MFS family permease